MRLIRATIEGYRSIREQTVVTFDPHVTAVLGANDHGKTNLLAALLHLNADHPFGPDDLNWDCEDSSSSLPYIQRA